MGSQNILSFLMMEAFTEMEVDGRLDNGAVEIPSDEEYI